VSPLVECPTCSGTRGTEHAIYHSSSVDLDDGDLRFEPCDGCDGEGMVRLRDVADDELGAFVDHPAIAGELARRGFVAFGRDCSGAIVPCTADDLACGCEPLQAVA